MIVTFHQPACSTTSVFAETLRARFEFTSPAVAGHRRPFCRPAAVLFAAGRLDEDVIRIDRNLYFPAGGTEPMVRGCASFADWRKRGFDRNSLIADPLFVDPARDDYSLRPESPAFQLDFEPIDTSTVGLLGDRCRCPIRPAAPEFGLANTRACDSVKLPPASAGAAQ